ncbi:MAG: hypothetical protein ABI811_21625 [Acidobacteriota bacterium]
MPTVNGLSAPSVVSVWITSPLRRLVEASYVTLKFGTEPVVPASR